MRKPKTQQPKTLSETLGCLIASDIFAAGHGPHGSCTRIQFLAGDWKTREYPQGGLCEAALAKAITESLRVHFGA